MAQAVIRRPFTSGIWFRFQVTPVDVCSEETRTRTSLSPILRFYLVSIIPCSRTGCSYQTDRRVKPGDFQNKIGDY